MVDLTDRDERVIAAATTAAEVGRLSNAPDHRLEGLLDIIARLRPATPRPDQGEQR